MLDEPQDLPLLLLDTAEFLLIGNKNRVMREEGEVRVSLTLVRIPVPPQQVSTQRESERETRPQQQGWTQPKSRVLVLRQQGDRQRLARLDTFPSTFSDPAG